MANENFDKPIYQRLRELGHDVQSIAEEFSRVSDDEVQSKARDYFDI